VRVGAVVPAVVAVLVAGCAPAGGQAAVERAAEDFSGAVVAGDGDRACALLAPLSRRELEDAAQQPCAEAVLGLDLPPVVESVEVRRYGRAGQVRLAGPDGEQDTRFVGLVDGAWLVTAAGCTPRGDLPLDCDIAGP